jgi:CBS domain-containing protein
LPGLVTKTLTVGTSNTEALRTMTDYRLSVALIVDRDGHIAGVIERVQLISTMLLAAAPQ